MKFRLWPRSLVGQLVFAVAVMLFVAQAINFALLVRGQRQQFLAHGGGMFLCASSIRRPSWSGGIRGVNKKPRHKSEQLRETGTAPGPLSRARLRTRVPEIGGAS